MADVALVLVQEQRDLDLREWVEAAQGLAFLRGKGLNARGYMVRNNRQCEHLASTLRHSQPAVVFIHCGIEQLPGTHALLNHLKSTTPKTNIVVGGAYGTLCSHEFTAHQAVSSVVLGEWIEALAELCSAILADGSGSDINGVWWKGRQGWELTARRKYAPDLADWPIPDSEDFRARELLRMSGGCAAITASRGTPFQTLFTPEPLLRNLQISESWYWVRPAKLVVEEAQQLNSLFGAREFHFVDDIFPFDQQWTEEFAKEWARQVRRPFHIRTAAEHLTRERLTPLREAGLKSVELCLESGNDVLRARLSDINQTNQQVREVLDRCSRMEIETRLRLLLGLPHETSRTIAETVEMAKSYPADHVDAEIYNPWPESSHWTELERSLTGSTMDRGARIRDIPEMRRDVVVALGDVQTAHSVRRALKKKPAAGVTFDAQREFPKAVIRSPFESAARIASFVSPSGTQEVIALHLPSEITWKVNIPSRPVLEFGILIEPRLPGERARLPVSFSVKVTQSERTYRVFQKILIQALDPDSRRWHWFKLPLTSIKQGKAEFTLENVIYGRESDYLPEDDIWAGWGKLAITSLDHTLEKGYQHKTDFEGYN